MAGRRAGRRTGEASGWDGSAWKLTKVWEKNDWGEGNSSPVAAGGKVYLTGWRDGQDHVVCLDVATGKELWRQSVKARQFSRNLKTSRGNQRHIGGPISTPTLDAKTGRLYTYSCDGILACWDTTAAGKPVWQKDLLGTYRPKIAREEFGQVSSPLIDGDRVVVEVGDQPSGHLIAFDARTGEEVWRSKIGRVHGRSGGPVKTTVAGKDGYVSFAEGLLLVIDKATGETVGQAPWDAQWGHYCATPAVAPDGKILVTSQGRTPTTLLEVSPVAIKEIWTSKVRSKVVSPVISADGSLAFFCDGGRIRCLDLATGEPAGETKARVGGDSEGAMILTGDGKLIAWGGNRLALLTADKALTELASETNVLENKDRCYPHVALAGGYLIAKARNGQTACYKVGP